MYGFLGWPLHMYIQLHKPILLKQYLCSTIVESGGSQSVWNQICDKNSKYIIISPGISNLPIYRPQIKN